MKMGDSKIRGENSEAPSNVRSDEKNQPDAA